MKSYRIAHTDLEVSRIGYGCMKLGGSWDQNRPGADVINAAEDAVLTAYEQGITLFDHADIYARGKSEAVFGEVLRRNPGLRERIMIQSKCGIRFRDDPTPGSPGRYDFSAAHILQSVDDSLQRLGIEQLDILLLHRPDPLVELEEVARAFDTLQERGTVRYFGVSNHTGAQIAFLQSYLDQPLIINQVELNVVHSHLINDGVVANSNGGEYAATGGTLEYCRQHKLLIQAWAPLAGGALVNPAADAEEHLRQAAALAQRIANERGTSIEAILLAWLLRHPAGIQPIIGTTRPDRIVAACQADAIELSREEWYALFIAARGRPLP